VALLFFGVRAPAAWAADLYVELTATSSDGANDCQTQSSPCLTLTHALTQAVSGDTIHLALFHICSASSGETFPLALKDGVAIIGDLDWQQLSLAAPRVQISAPSSTIFHNDGTSPLSPATRLAGVVLAYDFNVHANGNVFIKLDLADQTLSPRIDHNYFWSAAGYEETGVALVGVDATAATCSPTIDSNEFYRTYEAVLVDPGPGGGDDTFTPTIDANTFTNCPYPVTYDLLGATAGTVAGSVTNNHSSTTTGADVSFLLAASGTPGLAVNPTISGNTFAGVDNIVVNGNLWQPAGDVTFSPTISNNSLTATDGSNFSASSFMNGGSGNVTFAPVLRDNPTMSATEHNFFLRAPYWNVDGNVSHAPTISGNRMTAAAGDAVLINLYWMLVSASSQEKGISPTIVGNVIEAPAGNGVLLDLDDLRVGRFVSDMTISDNVITSPGIAGIGLSFYDFIDVTGLDWTITLDNNTITEATFSGISLSEYSMSYAGSGTLDFTVAGNTITDAGAYGILASPAYSFGSRNATDVTVLVSGNTVSGAVHDGVNLYLSGQTGNTLDARITDNVLQGNGWSGLQWHSGGLGSNGALVACNTMTGNEYGAWQDIQDDPPADFGGGSRSSPGNNVLTGNSFTDLLNWDDAPLAARFNYWGTTDPLAIDAHIYDDNENANKGAVDFSDFLTAAPTVTVAATLTDAVVVDLAPPGASLGDTLEYTATIMVPAGGCGDTALVFTCDIPTNTTLVAGSVTTSKGAVTSESPIHVDLGSVSAGETVTITWREVADSGAQVSCQGAVTAARSGTTPSDDPDTPTAADPTVTALLQQAAAEPIPTLGQWALLCLGGLLLLLGVSLLRRGRVAAAGLAMTLALGSALAGAAPPRRDGAKPRKEHTVTASTIKSAVVSGETATLRLADGTSITVPRRTLRVNDLRALPERPDMTDLSEADRLIELTRLKVARQAERAARQAAWDAMTPAERFRERAQQRLENRQQRAARVAARRDPLAVLVEGVPVVARVTSNGDGTVRNTFLDLYPSEELARAEAERFLNRREAGEARRNRN